MCDSHIVQTNPKAVERVSIKLYDHIERRICPAGALAAFMAWGDGLLLPVPVILTWRHAERGSLAIVAASAALS